MINDGPIEVNYGTLENLLKISKELVEHLTRLTSREGENIGRIKHLDLEGIREYYTREDSVTLSSKEEIIN